MVLPTENVVVYNDGTKCVIVRDDPQRSPEDVARISILRRERWLLLSDYASKSVSNDADRDAACYRARRRIDEVNAELFQLTKNPIYDN